MPDGEPVGAGPAVGRRGDGMPVPLVEAGAPLAGMRSAMLADSSTTSAVKG